MHHRTVFEAKAAHLVRCGPSTGLGAVVTEGNAALSDRPHERVVNLSHAFHYTAPSLVSSVGSVGLGRALEASGAGSCFGVAPSTSRWPSAWTITLVNVICADAPPLDSASVASCVGRILPNSELNALEFSIASFAKYSSPPTRSSEARIMSLSALLTLLSDPFGRPAPARGPP